MTQILLLIRLILCFLLFFAVYKPIFVLYNAPAPVSFSDMLDIWWHAIRIDLSTACYLTAPVLILLLFSNWLPARPPKRQPTGWRAACLNFYFAVVSLVVSICICVDCVLYSFWNFKLDATIWNYISSPKEIIASASSLTVIAGILTIIVAALLLFLLLRRASHYYSIPQTRGKRLRLTGCLILVGGLMFLAIRGGIGRSSMNVGYAYFSQNQFLNYSAVNPIFSLASSSLKSSDTKQSYTFFKADELDELWQTARPDTTSHFEVDSLTNTRPNILLIIIESFFANFIEPLGGEPGITPKINDLCREGILFSQCYSCSYRTDRANVSILSGYPSFPHLSVMKLPHKSRTLPSIARSLKRVGYNTTFLYGGDINFANKQSYLIGTGYDHAIGYSHFPVSTRTTHAWGVTDHIMLDTLFNFVQRASEPYFITALTLSSHEPWVVPYNRIPGNERANAMAYTDQALGRLISRLRQTPAWDNLLVVLVADHGVTYPHGLTEANPSKHHVPLLFLGGAVTEPRTVDKLCTQTDIAATLLDMLNLPHDEFTFSRDVLSPTYVPTAYYTSSNIIAFIDSTGYTIYDLQAKQSLADSPQPSESRLKKAKVFLQKSVEDLSAR